MKQGSLLMLWMDENASQQSNEKLLMKENLQLLFDSTTKQARTAPTLLKNPYSRFGLISSCADQFNSWCCPMLRCLFTCIFHNL